jgi:hypothetical protein
MIEYTHTHIYVYTGNKRTNDKFPHDEQTVNGLRKISWASVFCLKRQHIYIYIYTYLYMYILIQLYIYCICIYVYVCIHICTKRKRQRNLVFLGP